MKTHLQPFLGSFTARLHVEGVSGHEGTRGDAEGHRPVRHHRQAADSPHEAAVGRAEVPGRVCMVSSLFVYVRLGVNFANIFGTKAEQLLRR